MNKLGTFGFGNKETVYMNRLLKSPYLVPINPSYHIILKAI